MRRLTIAVCALVPTIALALYVSPADTLLWGLFDPPAPAGPAAVSLTAPPPPRPPSNTLPLPPSTWDLSPLPRISGNTTLKASPFGRQVKTVVIIELLKESMCSPHRSDWRGALPRWIAGLVALQGGEVVVWRPSYSMEDAVYRQPPRPDTMHCYPEPVEGMTENLFHFKDWLRERKLSYVDMVLVVGSSQPQAPGCSRILHHSRGKYSKVPHVFMCERDPLWEMKYALSKLWIGWKTKLFQIPVSADEEVNLNRVARGIDAIIHDRDFVKLDQYDQSLWAECSSYQREKKLLFLGSHSPQKGQMEFLRRVDPGLVRGHTIEFLAAAPFELEEMYKRVAMERGLDIKVHRTIRRNEQLVRAFCTSVGAVMYSISDSNPRQVGDVFRAGLPLLATNQTNLPEVVMAQPSVVLADSGQGRFDAEMRRFLRLVGQRGALLDSISSFIDRFGSPDTVFETVCVKLGLCEAPLD